eukprot:COSAG03_NODE_27138_length_255_cov_0.641026_1_plen_47_part_01
MHLASTGTVGECQLSPQSSSLLESASRHCNAGRPLAVRATPETADGR